MLCKSTFDSTKAFCSYLSVGLRIFFHFQLLKVEYLLIESIKFEKIRAVYSNILARHKIMRNSTHVHIAKKRKLRNQFPFLSSGATTGSMHGLKSRSITNCLPSKEATSHKKRNISGASSGHFYKMFIGRELRHSGIASDAFLDRNYSPPRNLFLTSLLQLLSLLW